jgi:murein DD-endopeptidase MepM/ murein hydrolase activator NlpD
MTDAAPTPVSAAGRFRWPARGRIIVGFGAEQPDGKRSEGINLAVPLGTEIHAAEAGRVHYAGDGLKGYGNLILIRHANGWVSAYAHADQMLVKAGDEVRRGQVIGKAGKTGPVTQPQLRFELRKGSQPVDPLPHLAN